MSVKAKYSQCSTDFLVSEYMRLEIENIKLQGKLEAVCGINYVELENKCLRGLLSEVVKSCVNGKLKNSERLTRKINSFLTKK